MAPFYRRIPRALAATGMGLLLLAASAARARTLAPDAPNAFALARAARRHFDQTQPAHPPGILLTEPTRFVEARLGYTAEVPNLSPSAWVVFAAIPPNLPSQHVDYFHVTPSTMDVADQRLPSRRLTLSLLSPTPGADPHRLAIASTCRVQLFKRTFVEATVRSPDLAPAQAPALSSAELAEYLDPSETLDFATPAFQELLDRNDLRPHADETELDFARRVFITLKPQLRYEYRATLDRHSSHVWASGASDCGGLNGLYVSVLRANGIPARTLCGRWARSAVNSQMLGGLHYYQWHVKAEFFLRTVGWIPVDLSGAVQCAPQGDSGLVYFGQDHGDFITMHVDFDLHLDTLKFGSQSILADQGFAYWVTGSGTLAGQTGHESWHVRELPVIGELTRNPHE